VHLTKIPTSPLGPCTAGGGWVERRSSGPGEIVILDRYH
jgi:hypothetical protein